MDTERLLNFVGHPLTVATAAVAFLLAAVCQLVAS